MKKPISRRTLITKPQQFVVIPKQSEVYRGFQIHYDAEFDQYAVVKPNERVERDNSIEAIRAAIDLIHLTDAMTTKRDIDMQAISRMTQSSEYD